MKKFLLIGLILIGVFNKLNAQCTVANLAVNLKSVVTIGDQCEAVFDFSWDQDVNNGNKYAYIHLWRSDQYPNLSGNGLAYTTASDFPTSGDLANAMATIVIENNGSATPVIGVTYYPEPAVPVLSTGLSVVKETINMTWERMTVNNITLIIPACTGTGLTGDIWSSEAENGKNVHCVSSGVSVIIGNPRIVGLLFCQAPRQYNTQITNVGNADITVNYNVYIDEGDGVYEPQIHDLKITAVPVGPITLSPGSTYNSGIQSYLPWSNQKPYSDHGLWVEVSTVGFPNKAIAFIDNSCFPLPISLDAFTAKRDRATVQLNWQTSSEINNSGFELQRRIGSENFQAIAFVPSQALMGNSQTSLYYNYNDVNPSTGISEYRLRQIDIDGRSKYSEIRSVRGEGQRNEMIIYPNPIVNNTVKILFENANATHDISIFDGNGRVVKKWNNITGQDLFIGNIIPGIYTLQVINNETKERTIEKIVVLK